MGESRVRDQTLTGYGLQPGKDRLPVNNDRPTTPSRTGDQPGPVGQLLRRRRDGRDMSGWHHSTPLPPAWPPDRFEVRSTRPVPDGAAADRYHFPQAAHEAASRLR